MPRFKLVFFVPAKDTSRVLNHIFAKLPQTAGKIGQYESCAFMTRGTGQFKPGSDANPVIGTRGVLELVEEDRVEFVVHDEGQNEEIRGAIQELKSVSGMILLTAWRYDFCYLGTPLRRSRVRRLPTRGFLKN